MREPARCRRFTIGDAMLLVAATATSLAYLRHTMVGYYNFRTLTIPNSPVAGWLHGGEWVASAFLTTWTFALLLARGLPPRPQRVRIARQPGMVACSAACLSMVAMIPDYFPIWSSFWPDYERALRPWNALVCVTHNGGLLVITAWAAVASARAWRPEPGWIDGMGRLVGLLWIALFLTGYVTQIARTLGW